MKQHQANEVKELVIETIKSWKTTPDGWEPRSNCNFGISIECRERQLMDELHRTPPGDKHREKRRDEIACILTDLSYIIGTVLGGSDTGWYCFFCGWLFPEEVTNDERCTKCDSLLPARRKCYGKK